MTISLSKIKEDIFYFEREITTRQAENIQHKTVVDSRAKETAPIPIAKTEAQCAPMKQKLTGSILMRSSLVTLGFSRASGASHKKMPYNDPTASWRLAKVIGNPVFPPAALRAILLVILYYRRWMLVHMVRCSTYNFLVKPKVH